MDFAIGTGLTLENLWRCERGGLIQGVTRWKELADQVMEAVRQALGD